MRVLEAAGGDLCAGPLEPCWQGLQTVPPLLVGMCVAAADLYVPFCCGHLNRMGFAHQPTNAGGDESRHGPSVESGSRAWPADCVNIDTCDRSIRSVYSPTSHGDPLSALSPREC